MRSQFRAVRGRARSFLVAAGLVAGSVLVPAAAQAAPHATPVAVPARAAASAATVPERLRTVVGVLDRSARIAGTAWAVAGGAERLEVLADPSVSGADLGRLRALLRPYGDAVRVRRVAGRIGTRLSGGDPVYGGPYRCTVGVNVVGGGTYYFLTAGHCGNVASTWYADAAHTTVVGTTAASSFPGDDYAIVRYVTGVSHSGTIGSQDVTSAANAYVGEHVCMRGPVSGVRCGTVLALNATVNYAEGTVYGLIETNICAEPGDSGAPLYDGQKVLGILSGASGNCTTGGVSFFQPITEALSVYGVSVY